MNIIYLLLTVVSLNQFGTPSLGFEQNEKH